MEQQHYQQQRQQLHQQKQTAHKDSHQTVPQKTADRLCPRCGARVEPGNRFCEECGASLNSCQCSHCGGFVERLVGLCPHCGRPLSAGQCSFCGESMDDDEQFCSSCGNPRHGIVCPQCGELNFRSFCRKCNTPLNQLAQKAIEKARNHPAVKRARQLAQELEQLQQQIEQLGGTMNAARPILPDEREQRVSESDLQLLNSYQQLLKGSLPPTPIMSQPASQPAKCNTLELQDRLKKALEEYDRKAAEMQDALDQMLPDPSDPPEEQRNFLSACLMETYSTTVTRETKCTGWVCNYCGCHHQQPMDCCQPELGGRWIYETVETINTIKHQNIIYM